MRNNFLFLKNQKGEQMKIQVLKKIVISSLVLATSLNAASNVSVGYEISKVKFHDQAQDINNYGSMLDQYDSNTTNNLFIRAGVSTPSTNQDNYVFATDANLYYSKAKIQADTNNYVTLANEFLPGLLTTLKLGGGVTRLKWAEHQPLPQIFAGASIFQTTEPKISAPTVYFISYGVSFSTPKQALKFDFKKGDNYNSKALMWTLGLNKDSFSIEGEREKYSKDFSANETQIPGETSMSRSTEATNNSIKMFYTYIF